MTYDTEQHETARLYSQNSTFIAFCIRTERIVFLSKVFSDCVDVKDRKLLSTDT